MSRWFRHYAGLARDDKMVRAAIKSQQPVERVIWVWVAILESAAEINDNGRYDFDADEAAYFLRADADELRRIESVLADLGRIDCGAVAKWSDRQFTSDNSTARVKRFREKRNVQGGVTNEALAVSETTVKRFRNAPKTETETQVSSNELTKTRGKRAQRGFSPEFEEFWSAYPRRPGNPKELASRKFETLRAAGVDPAAIIAGAKGYAGYCVGKEPQFIAQASTWLNNGRWKDDYSAAAKPLVSRPEPDRTGSIWVPAESAPWRAWRDAKGAGFLAARKKDRAGYPDGGAWLPTEYPDARKSA